MWITLGETNALLLKTGDLSGFIIKRDVDKRMWIKLSTSFYPHQKNKNKKRLTLCI
jgi:hypothetical protein